VVTRYPYPLIQKLLEHEPASMRALIDSAFHAASRLQRHMRVLVRSTAQARVAGFLLEVAGRVADEGDVMLLPMTLHDVGNYLLLSDDAIREALLQWIANGAIELLGERRIHILDAPQLAAPA
jgi:CRP-like cAMP-binding protein